MHKLITILVIIISILGSTGEALTTEICSSTNIEFNKPSKSKFIEYIVINDHQIKKPVISEIAGKNYITLGYNVDSYYLVANISKEFISKYVNEVEITVEYLDKGYGMFTIMYNSSEIKCSLKTNNSNNMFYTNENIRLSTTLANNTEKQTDVVYLQNTNKLISYTFKINDASFDDKINSGDFRIGAYVHSEGRFSQSNIYIHKIDVKKVSNKTDNNLLVDVNYNINDTSNGISLIHGTTTVDLNDGSIDLTSNYPAAYNGLFSVEIQLINGVTGEQTVSSFPISIMPKNKSTSKENDIFGVCTHFGKGWNPTNMKDRIKTINNIGIGWIRDEMEWSKAERVMGEIKVLPEWDEYIELAVAAGLEPLVILNYGNKLYDQGGSPYTKEGITAFNEYVKTIVTHFKGRVNHFEVWNEYNQEGTLSNPTSRSPQDYTLLLKQTYNTIKQINPNAMVIGGAMSGADFDWLREVFESGGINYLDAISFHPYAFTEGLGQDGFIASVNNARELANEFGRKLPIWITEIGWPTFTGCDNITDLDISAYMIRTYTEGIVNNVDKVFWYNFQNNSTSVDDVESNFGLVKNWWDAQSPMGAKGSYLGYNTMTNMLADSKYQNNLSKDNLKAYQFKNDSNDTVIIFWSLDNEINFSLLGVIEPAKIYSIYSFENTIKPSNNILNLSATGYPLFIVIKNSSDNLKLVIN